MNSFLPSSRTLLGKWSLLTSRFVYWWPLYGRIISHWGTANFEMTNLIDEAKVHHFAHFFCRKMFVRKIWNWMKSKVLHHVADVCFLAFSSLKVLFQMWDKSTGILKGEVLWSFTSSSKRVWVLYGPLRWQSAR